MTRARIASPDGRDIRTKRYFAMGEYGWRTAILDIHRTRSILPWPQVLALPPDPEYWRTRDIARVLRTEFPKLRARHRMRTGSGPLYDGVYVNVYRGAGKAVDHALFRRVEKRLLELALMPRDKLTKLVEKKTKEYALP